MKPYLLCSMILFLCSCSAPIPDLLVQEISSEGASDEVVSCTAYQWYGESVESFSSVEASPFDYSKKVIVPDDMLKSLEAYRVSPDESLFAYTSFPHAYLYDWQKEEKFHLFDLAHDNSWGVIYRPIWSADGSKLAFLIDGSRCTTNGETEVLVITIDQVDLGQSQWKVYDVDVGVSVSDQAPYPTLFEFQSNDAIEYTTCSNHRSGDDCPTLILSL